MTAKKKVEIAKEELVTEDSKIKLGTLELEINQRQDMPFVPHSSPIIGNIYELETIALGIRDNLPVLVIGDTGTGKTSFIRYLANKTNNGFRRLNLNGSTTADELVGHYVVDDKATGMRWVKGVLYEAMEQGHWLLLDELNAGLPEVLFVLQSVLDDDKMLVVPEHEGEIIRPHADFRIFATMNPSMEYAGTRDLNKALLSRFPIVIQTHYPDAVHEIEIIKSHVSGIDDKDLNTMVRIAEDIRKGKKENSLSFICSTRELINWAKLTNSIGLKAAAELALLNKCELESDRKGVEDIFKMLFGHWEKNQIMTLTDIEKQLEQMKTEVQTLEQAKQAQGIAQAALQTELDSYRKIIGMAAGKTPGSVTSYTGQ